MDLEIEDIKPDISELREFLKDIDGVDFENITAFDLKNPIVPKDRRHDGGEQNVDYEQGYRDGYADAFRLNNRNVVNTYNLRRDQGEPLEKQPKLRRSRRSPKPGPVAKQSLEDSQYSSIRKFRLAPSVSKPLNSIIVSFKKVNGISTNLTESPNLPIVHETRAVTSRLNCIAEKSSFTVKNENKLGLRRLAQMGRENKTVIGKKLVVTHRNIAKLGVHDTDSINIRDESLHGENENSLNEDEQNENLLHENLNQFCLEASNGFDLINQVNNCAAGAEVTPSEENKDKGQNVSDDENTVALSIFSDESELNVLELDKEFSKSLAVDAVPNNLRNLSLVSVKEKKQHICYSCGRPFTSAGRLKQHNRTHCPYGKVIEKHCKESVINVNDFADTTTTDVISEDVISGTQQGFLLNEEGDRVQRYSNTSDKSDRAHSCPICHNRFKTNAEVYRHIARVHGTEELHCEICSKVFSTRFKLLRHHKCTHSNDPSNPMPKRYLCPQCDTRFVTAQSLREHLNRHAGIRPYGCHECRARFTSQTGAREHARSHRSEMPFQCDKCLKRFKWVKGLKRHQSSCLEPGQLKVLHEARESCETCGKCFRTRARLAIHQRQHTDERPFKCTSCEKAFTCAEHLSGHWRKQHGVKKFGCESCPRRYTTRSRLRAHMQVHSEERPHACAICGATFKSRLALKDHANRHAGIKPHACSVCPARFVTYAEIRDHQRAHGNKREFVCETCGRAYNRQKHLLVHRTVHTGEKRFACSHCGKFFRRSMQLRIHVRCHTGEQPYLCVVCNRRFAQRGRYTSHLLTHTGEKPFQCTMCEWAFCRKDKLQDHQRRIHKTNTVPEKSEIEPLNTVDVAT